MIFVLNNICLSIMITLALASIWVWLVAFVKMIFHKDNH